MYEKNFFKLVCESVSPWEKTIHLDVNCNTLEDVNKITSSHPELMTMDKIWILYPMSVIVK